MSVVCTSVASLECIIPTNTSCTINIMYEDVGMAMPKQGVAMAVCRQGRDDCMQLNIKHR